MIEKFGYESFSESINFIFKNYPEISFEIYLLNQDLLPDHLNILLFNNIYFSNDLIEKLPILFFQISNPLKIIIYLDGSQLKNWRKRFLLLQQCIKISNFLGNFLIDIAKKYSNDDVALIRSESVNLICNIINQNHSNYIFFKNLIISNWHQRLILAKIIKKLNHLNIFQNELNILKNDIVENIRFQLKEL